MLSKENTDARASREIACAPKMSATVIRASVTGLLCMGFAISACDPFTIMNERDPESLEAYYSGCHTVYEGPVCELPEFSEDTEQKLTFWVAGHEAPTIQFNSERGNKEFSPEFIKTEDGLRFQLVAPEQAGSFTFDVSQPQERSWSLEVRPYESRHPVLLEAAKLRKDKKHAQVKTLLEPKLADLTPRELGEALSLLGRSELSLKNAPEAIEKLEQAYEAHIKAGSFGAAVRDTTTYAWTSIYRMGMQFDKASLHVNKMQGLLPNHYDSQHFYRWSQALIAEKSSNHRGALNFSQGAMALAKKIGNQRNADYLAHIYSCALMNLHQFAQAAKVLEDRVSRIVLENPTCEDAENLNSLGWAQLLHKLDSQSDSDTMGTPAKELPDPTRHFENALQISQDTTICHADKQEDTNSILNLSLMFLAKKEFKEARRYLAKAEATGKVSTYYQMWFEQTHADLYLNQDQPQLALQHFSKLRQLSKNSPHAYLHWRGLVGAAAAQASLGQHQKAQDFWEQAQAHVERESLQAPIHAGRESFLAHRQKATQAYVASLLQSGEAEKALKVIRRARSQLLQNLQWNSRTANLEDGKMAQWQTAMAQYKQTRTELQDLKTNLWQLPEYELRQALNKAESLERKVRQNLDTTFALLDMQRTESTSQAHSFKPGENEIVLTYFKLKESWVGFLETQRSVSFRLLGNLPETQSLQALSKVLLGPFKETLLQANKAYFQPWGKLREVDFHRLPIDRKPLIQFTQVAYSLSLRSSVPSQSNEPLKALIVSDPAGNLPLARQEALAVSTILKQDLLAQVNQVSGESADLKTVKSAMKGVHLFHYAGHGQFRKNGISDSALLLADNTQLNIGDIMVLPQAPQSVILSACESAKTDKAFPLESLGLAQAFALAGSNVVIASTRPVKDELSRYITTQLYKSYQTSGDFAAALQDAQIMASQQYPDADWSTFRLITPN